MDRNEKFFSKLILIFIMLIMVFGAWHLNMLNENIVLRIGVFAGSYWNTPNEDSYQILDKAIERFEKENPNITVEYVSGIRPAEYSEWLAEQILLGKEPDVFMVLPEDFIMLASSGILMDLSRMIETDSTFSGEDYYQTCLDAGKYNGKQYALPQESVPTIMFVNRTLLEESNIPVPDSEWTWDDFYRICGQITNAEKHLYGVYDYTWINALYSNGASLFSSDGKACYLNDPRIQQAIQFVIKLDELNKGYQVTSRDFDLGNVAFRPFLYSEYRAYQPYPWRVKKYTGFEWEGITMPAGPSGDNISELHTMLLGLSARTTKKDAAWEFAKLLSYDEDIQRSLCRNSSGISPLTAVAEDDETLALICENMPDESLFDRNAIHKVMSSAVIMPNFAKFSQALGMAEAAVAEQMKTGEISAGTLVIDQRDINRFLNDR